MSRAQANQVALAIDAGDPVSPWYWIAAIGCLVALVILPGMWA